MDYGAHDFSLAHLLSLCFLAIKKKRDLGLEKGEVQERGSTRGKEGVPLGYKEGSP